MSISTPHIFNIFICDLIFDDIDIDLANYVADTIPYAYDLENKKVIYPANICLFRVNNRNTRIRCKICSKLTIRISEQRQLTSFWCFYC